MKKFVFILLAFAAGILGLSAQQFHIEKSAAFDEPDYGWNKLLQLKNGNTFFFHSTRKDGIEVTVYNKQRKQIASRTLESGLWDVSKMKQSRIVGLYEINGEPIIFVMQAEDWQPTLYRMRINPNTGAIVNEAKLGHLPKITAAMNFATVYGHLDPSDIIVEKDPNSDCYTTIFFNTQAHDRSERIKVVHYDGTHKIIGQSFYESPNHAFKYLRYIGSVVDGNKRVYLTTYGYNTRSGEANSKVIVSRLSAGDTGFVHKILDFSDDFDDTKSVMLYNHASNKIQLLTLSYSESKHHLLGNKTDNLYFSILSFIDPETLSLIDAKPFVGAKVNAYGKTNIDKDYEFNGMPQNMILNKDNTTTVLSEEIKIIERTSGHTHTIKTLLGPAGVTELSDAGVELSGYAVSKQQQGVGEYPTLYMSGRSKGQFKYFRQVTSWGHGNNNEFLSYDYVNAEKGHYIIFNDLPGNSDRDEDDEKRKTVAYVSKTNTMCYKLNGQSMDKLYLFGEPKDDSKSTFCYIESSDYNKESNSYATMIVERDGRDKEAKIAWVTFE
jgi:hypothetical protein